MGFYCLSNRGFDWMSAIDKQITIPNIGTSIIELVISNDGLHTFVLIIRYNEV